MLKKLYLFMAVMLSALFCSCSDNNSDSGDPTKDGPKPEMSVVVTPQSGLKFGDKLIVSGTMTDEKNLQKYTLLLKDANGDTLSSKVQMLLGQSFNINDNLTIPLPKNAATGNLKVDVVLDNTRNGELVQSFDLTNVAVPEFESLNLVLSNGTVLDMVKNGDVFETVSENLFPANIKGIISTTTSKNGIYWGTQNGEIASMSKDSITIGSDLEASYTVSFNPKTFELKFGEKHVWTPLDASDAYYILGTISGHWKDGNITTERTKMKMTGYESGTSKYYTWTPPEGDDPETGMWGSTAAGMFRLKQAGKSQYILWDGSKIVQSATDDPSKSFPVTAGGAFNFRVYFEGSTCTKVQIIGSDKTLEFSNGSVKINGLAMKSTTNFAGSTLPLKSGASYIYEGTISMTKGQSISATMDLSKFSPNTDLFTGKGNTSWTLKTYSGKYYVRMDAFSGAFYACPTSGFPDFIYMDGWSWGPDNLSSVTWDGSNVLPLTHISGTIYEGICYVYDWGGDIAFYVTHPSSGNSYRIPNTIFTDTYKSSADDTGFMLPTTAGYYKVVVDLKDGINVNANGTVTPKGSTKCTLNYVAQ